MDDHIKRLLKEVVKDLTNEGENMGGLLYTKEEVVYRLRETLKVDEANQIEAAETFRLTAKDGLVRLWTGPSYTRTENLIDFKDDSNG